MTAILLVILIAVVSSFVVSFLFCRPIKKDITASKSRISELEKNHFKMKAEIYQLSNPEYKVITHIHKHKEIKSVPKKKEQSLVQRSGLAIYGPTNSATKNEKMDKYGDIWNG